MRIVQLSDIHLSAINRDSLVNYYLKALIEDLRDFHDQKPIDIILITGDLVDKGGASLGRNPYETFQKIFINPIASELNINSSQILFIPGNHDVNREKIDEENEVFLLTRLTTDSANKELKKQHDKFTKANKRIKKFKDFEKSFHENTPNYNYSNNESIYVVSENKYKFGFALINDSWRCSDTLDKEKHFIGVDQLYNSNLFFSKKKIDISIAVFHHPLESINTLESEEIDNALQSMNFDLAFFGHSHRYKYQSIISSNGGILKISNRTAFNNPSEEASKYQPGYNVIDIEPSSKDYTIYARKYIHSHYRFDRDVEAFPDGQKSGKLNHSAYTSLVDSIKSNESVLNTDDLPKGYSADVNKIVKLLIGKSLYPNSSVFVRELIQNSVDACNRVKETNEESDPRIKVLINSSDNSFEIIDEGDGMSKRVLREHFSIVGKSISQDFSDSADGASLISQFGIGFISTFMVSQNIIINTKSKEDGLVNFEINSVFNEFIYNDLPTSDYISKQSTGTSVKVILKRSFSVVSLLYYVKNYCRHVSNLEYYLDGTRQIDSDSWNTENAIYEWRRKTNKYECRLAIGYNSRNVIATNSGFLINDNSLEIIPFNFPVIIGGEIIFQPRAIDLDLSRSNIISSDKSLEVKREISIALRELFREVIEQSTDSLRDRVLDYLQYYLFVYDHNQNRVLNEYVSFYSKIELINLCSEQVKINYRGFYYSISQAILLLRTQPDNYIYFNDANNPSELKTIVTNSLIGQGKLVIYDHQITVQTRDSITSFSANAVKLIIMRYHGVNVINIDEIIHHQMTQIVVSKETIDHRIMNNIRKIEIKKLVSIDIARLGIGYNSSLLSNGKIYINYDHPSFESLLKELDTYSDAVIEAFLLGLLNLSASSIGISE